MSGFAYPEWIGDVYPEGTKRDGMLAEYARIFPAVEINMSFRRTPTDEAIARWRDTVPEAFRFTMKAHQRITHWKKLIDAADDVAIFVKASRGLGPKLGPILFQVPPTVTFDADVLDAFASTLPPGATYAFEWRDESFVGEHADEVLHRHGVARCLNDDLFDPKTYTVTGPFVYFRFHRDVYTEDDLVERAEMVKAYATSGADVYAFFQHEDNPESVRPALRFLDLLG